MEEGNTRKVLSVKPLQKGVALALLSTFAVPAMAELEVDAYGSLRTSVESVSVDEAAAGEDENFVTIRDAFSRFGVKASYPMAGGTTLGGKIEVPFNTQNFNAEDPTFFDDNSVRVAKITADGDWGSVVIGKDWLPYYNNIAYPVDLFSSFYSGWATYARFREYQAAYTTPSLGGLKFTAAAIQFDPQNDDGGAHYALSYSNGGFTAAVGMEDLDDGNETTSTTDTRGVSASYTSGPFYVAAKAEQQVPENGDDEPVIKNVYASYDYNDFTFRGMLAEGDEESFWAPGASYHLGMDYRYTDSFKAFAEYFYEENAYAILKEDAESYATAGAPGSEGQVFLVGARYDF